LFPKTFLLTAKRRVFSFPLSVNETLCARGVVTGATQLCAARPRDQEKAMLLSCYGCAARQLPLYVMTEQNQNRDQDHELIDRTLKDHVHSSRSSQQVNFLCPSCLATSLKST
jgi:hypothetical protein